MWREIARHCGLDPQSSHDNFTNYVRNLTQEAVFIKKIAGQVQRFYVDGVILCLEITSLWNEGVTFQVLAESSKMPNISI